ncbi:RNA polymerase sigma factor [Pedobacter sp. UBA5917]|jgi:DNA-directed RNA polymerase specialized sigma24 family protein|uniref:RNA polymerase sigma factor n=1 Tax=Pedobacter sp. UBA5917 TaxID=1947061 RepID=UPI0025CDEBD9|nr:hypothetical protein [Pedobacter sp. UBA5917]
MNVPVNRIVDQDSSLKVWLSNEEIFFDQLRNQDGKAFKLLYKQYAAAIYGAIIRKVNDEEKAKLILDQTFCEVWKSFDLYDATKLRIFSWIYQITLQNIRKTTV